MSEFSLLAREEEEETNLDETNERKEDTNLELLEMMVL